MEKARLIKLERTGERLTEDELREGWHYCPEWDFMLLNYNDKAGEPCSCKPWTDQEIIDALRKQLDRYTRLSESGESLGDSLDMREHIADLEKKLAALEALIGEYMSLHELSQNRSYPCGCTVCHKARQLDNAALNEYVAKAFEKAAQKYPSYVMIEEMMQEAAEWRAKK